MRANEYLNKAASIMEERAKTYDSESGERSMGKAVRAFNTITGQDLTEAEGWLLLQVLKDVRQWSKKDYHSDSAEDCIAYAALKAEALEDNELMNNRIREALNQNYERCIDGKHWAKHSLTQEWLPSEEAKQASKDVYDQVEKDERDSHDNARR